MLLNGFDSTAEIKPILAAGLVPAMVIRRTVVTRAIVSEVAPAENRRRWVVNTRNALLLPILASLTAIRAEVLRAVSLLASAAAIVIATKGLPQNVLGSLMWAGTNAHSIGGRVVIGSRRNAVIGQNPLVRVLTPVGRQGTIEEDIIRRLLEEFPGGAEWAPAENTPVSP